MWALVESGSVTQIIMRPKGLTIGDNQYPKNIFNLWSASELEAIGIYEVVLDNTNLKNDEYYDNTNQTFTFADNTVTASYGTATAKDLDDLKTLHKEKINARAGSLLASYDWYTLRAADGGTAVPSNVATYRTAVRSTANDMCNTINSAPNVDHLASLYVYSGDPAARPLGEWPVLGD
jgi:hypothetical protein